LLHVAEEVVVEKVKKKVPPPRKTANSNGSPTKKAASQHSKNNDVKRTSSAPGKSAAVKKTVEPASSTSRKAAGKSNVSSKADNTVLPQGKQNKPTSAPPAPASKKSAKVTSGSNKTPQSKPEPDESLPSDPPSKKRRISFTDSATPSDVLKALLHVKSEKPELSKNCALWDEDEVVQWLSSVSLSEAIPAFQLFGVSGPMLKGLSHESLEQFFCIEKPFLRARILNQVKLLISGNEDGDPENPWDSWNVDQVCEFFSAKPYKVDSRFFRDAFVQHDVTGSLLKFLSAEILVKDFHIEEFLVEAMILKLKLLFGEPL
jgi:hypothetical protein